MLSLFSTLFASKSQKKAKDQPANSAPVVKNVFLLPQQEYTGRVSTESIYTNIDWQQHLIYCREAYFQNPYARALLNRIVDIIVNDGLTLQFNPHWQRLHSKYSREEQQTKQMDVQERFQLWAASNNCMLKNDMNFHAAQHELYLTLLRDGEFFIILHRHYDEKNVNPLRLQVVGTDAVPYEALGDFEEQAAKRLHHIEHGIEYNEYEEAVAYYFCSQDGTITRIPTYNKEGRRLVVHVKRGDYINSTRGVSLLLPHLGTLAQIRDFERYELEASKVNSRIAAYVKPSNDDGASAILGEERIDGNVIPEIDGLVIQNLKAGQDLQVFNANSNRPSANVVEFVAKKIEAIMVSEGIPNSVAQLHMNKSYSASRAELGLLETFRKSKLEGFATCFLDIIFQEWLYEEVLYNDLILPGYINIKTRNFYKNTSWHPDPIPDLDPLKSAKAMELLISLGVITHEQATRNYNDGNWDDNIERLAREYAKRQELFDSSDEKSDAEENSEEAEEGNSDE